MSQTYLIIKPDNTKDEFLRGDGDDILTKLQTAVDGFIEMVTLPLDPISHVLIVNEEGMLRELPPNPIASWLLLSMGYEALIFGTAVLARRDGEELMPPHTALVEGLKKTWRWDD